MQFNLKKEESNFKKTGSKSSGIVGPGLIAGAADDDPSGIATYSQAGATTGFSLVWLSVLTLPMMVVVQEMSARIALATGRGLASNIKRHFSRKVLIFITVILIVANTLNIGADLSMMATVLNHMLPSIPVWVALIAISLLTISLEVFVSYKKYSKYLKWLTLALLSYVVTGFLVDIDFKELLLATFKPSLDSIKNNIYIITAILGTTISPYLFFWQASQEIESEILEGEDSIAKRIGESKEGIVKMRRDVWLGMFFSNLVMFFIIAVCGQTLFKNGITSIESASDAALSLRPLAGDFAYLLFSLGIIGTGLLAIPVIAGSSAYAISEAFGWKEGLYQKYNKARPFYMVIMVSVIVGLAFALFEVNPIKSLIYTAVLNGLIAPFIILCIIFLSKNEKIMGDCKNTRFLSACGWLLFASMLLAAVATLVSFF